MPGSVARIEDRFLAIMLFEAGDLTAAERVCAAVLTRCREAGELLGMPALLILLAMLDLRADRFGDAAAHLREAVQITLRTGDSWVLCDALECAGRLCAATGRFGDAITAWAAAITLNRQGGVVEPAVAARHRDEPMRRARQALGPDRVRAAEERGAAISLATAAEYALMLTAPAPPPAPAATGPGKLSARERELVTLVAQGRSDAQIAAELYISIRTVRSHLDRIGDKTGCRRRVDLTRLALSAGLV